MQGLDLDANSPPLAEPPTADVSLLQYTPIRALFPPLYCLYPPSIPIPELGNF